MSNSKNLHSCVQVLTKVGYIMYLAFKVATNLKKMVYLKWHIGREVFQQRQREPPHLELVHKYSMRQNKVHINVAITTAIIRTQNPTMILVQRLIDVD